MRYINLRFTYLLTY